MCGNVSTEDGAKEEQEEGVEAEAGLVALFLRLYDTPPPPPSYTHGCRAARFGLQEKRNRPQCQMSLLSRRRDFRI